MQENKLEILTLPCDTWQHQNAYLVRKGCVNVFVCTRKNNRADEKIYLCQAGAGKTVPAYSYVDLSHGRWYFILESVAEGTEVLETSVPVSQEEKLAFLRNCPAGELLEDAGICGDNVFEELLSQWYLEAQMMGVPEVPQSQLTETAAEPEAAPVLNAEPAEPEAVPILKAESAQQGSAGSRTEECKKAAEPAAERIVLRRDKRCYTEKKNGSLQVKAGKVHVFVEPRMGTDAQRALCIATLKAGDVIPMFFLVDAAHTVWRFKIESVGDSAELEAVSRKADPLEFLKSCGLEDQVTDLQQGLITFESAIVDWYAVKVLEPIPTIAREELEEEGEDSLYKAVAFACQENKIVCEPEEKLKIRCGGDPFTVPMIAEASHFICRKVILEENWWLSDCGPIISSIEDQPVACVPGRSGKYRIFYAETGEVKKLDKETAQTVTPTAFSIGRTLPGRKCRKKDLLDFCLKGIRSSDLLVVGVLGLIGALIGVLIPTLNQKIYDDYIPLGNYAQLVQLCTLIGSFMIGNMFMEIVKNLTEYRISSRITYDLQNAVIFRSFHLPEKTFRNLDSADLANRILQVDEIVTAYTDTFITGGFAALFSLTYLYKMFKATAKLSWAALAMLLLLAGFIYWISIRASRYEKKILKYNGEASARLFQYLNAIDKIRLAGAEDRAAKKYLNPVGESEKQQIRKNRLISFKDALNGVAVTIMTMVFYYIMIKKNVSISIGNFSAFNSAFGMLAGAVIAFVDGLIKIYMTKPNMERLMPVIENEPEYAENTGRAKHVVSDLGGKVELRDVSFRYSESSPMVLKNLNMTIDAGDYVGIVGKSGCGKSTLFKLLLGFEDPVSGTVLFDNANVADLDKKTFRRNLGVVLQNGKLINGSIFENITVTCPKATLKDVKEVIKAVGMEEDIKQMPMGLQTVLNENSSTISGGQQQRILIARAIVGKPNILLLDEATSALDNLTQKTVCESLDKMHATRIVIAHRLSTIKNCNKIYVLDGGKIIEQGSYEQLMAHKGLFAEMAVRQLAESEN